MCSTCRTGRAISKSGLRCCSTTGPTRCAAWQRLFRQHQPPTLLVRGGNDPILPAKGTYPCKRDLTDPEFHILDTGHVAPDADGNVIADRIIVLKGCLKPAGQAANDP